MHILNRCYLLHVREKECMLLEEMTERVVKMISQEELEEIYGPLARFSEHKPGDCIRYRHEGQTETGRVVWVYAPRPDEGLHLAYVVEPDSRGGIPDVVFPSDVLGTIE